MRTILLIVLFSVTSLHAQGDNGQSTDTITVGEVLQIGKPTTWKYNHIDFPRANFIIKQGGTANYKVLEGHKVVVTSIKEKRSGTLTVTLERRDGKKFFENYGSVTANLEKALTSSELHRIQ